MRKRAESKPEAELEPLSVSGDPEPEPLSGRGRRSRLGIWLTDSGQPDAASLREQDVAALKRAWTDPEIRRKLGLGGDAEPPEAVVQACGALWQALTAIEAWAVTTPRYGGLPKEVAARIFSASEEETQSIAKPAAQVVQKYFPNLSERSPEIQLGIMVARAQILKYLMYQQYLEERKQQQMETQKVNGGMRASGPRLESEE